MSTPAVTINEIDGALGALPPSLGRPLALAGVADDGPLDTPALFAGSSGQKAILATFKGGPTVEAACRALALGVAVAFVRTGSSTDGSFPEDDAVVVTGEGTSVVTVDTTTEPNDDYEAFVVFTAGGTIGTAGAELRWSLDGGRTLSPATALGTAESFTFPGSGGVTIDFAAGTVLTGQTIAFTTKAPKWNTSELTSALTGLQASSINWEILSIVGDLTPTDFDAVELAIAAMLAASKDRVWFGHPRIPEPGETEAEYRTAMDTAWASKATTFGGLAAGAAKITSAVSGRSYRRPLTFDFAPALAKVSEEIDLADVNLGSRPGVSIRDENGNPDEHDEYSSPGLDDLRFITLRTHPEPQGVYYNNPRLFSPAGSDFEFAQHRRVMNLGKAALRSYMIRRLSKPIRVNRKTGFILEEEALEIELGATRAMQSVLTQKPKASDAQFVLSRTDNLLSTKTLTGAAKITPLAYPKAINLDIAFSNPALQTVAA